MIGRPPLRGPRGLANSPLLKLGMIGTMFGRRTIRLLICAALLGCIVPPAALGNPIIPVKMVEAPSFDVSVRLTPKAEAELQRRHETIAVLAYFYGIANLAGSKYSDDMGQIWWAGNDRIELNAPGVAKFIPRALNVTVLDYLQNRKPEVLINVVSGRRSSPDNLLACTVFEDSVYLAAAKGIQIQCGLIG